MQFMIDGHAVFGATGGREHTRRAARSRCSCTAPGSTTAVWALQSRWLAFHGWNVLALDLPGHGRSAGPPLPSIAAMAAWLAAVIAAEAAGTRKSAALIGHSMGSLIALETAAQFPDRVQSHGIDRAPLRRCRCIRICSPPPPPTITPPSTWSIYGGTDKRRELGGSRAPGVWMVGAAERLLEKAAAGVLHNDLKHATPIAKVLPLRRWWRRPRC